MVELIGAGLVSKVPSWSTGKANRTWLSENLKYGRAAAIYTYSVGVAVAYDAFSVWKGKFGRYEIGNTVNIFGAAILATACTYTMKSCYNAYYNHTGMMSFEILKAALNSATIYFAATMAYNYMPTALNYVYNYPLITNVYSAIKNSGNPSVSAILVLGFTLVALTRAITPLVKYYCKGHDFLGNHFTAMHNENLAQAAELGVYTASNSVPQSIKEAAKLAGNAIRKEIATEPAPLDKTAAMKAELDRVRAAQEAKDLQIAQLIAELRAARENVSQSVDPVAKLQAATAVAAARMAVLASPARSAASSAAMLLPPDVFAGLNSPPPATIIHDSSALSAVTAAAAVGTTVNPSAPVAERS